jgi:DnaK suppressor protein
MLPTAFSLPPLPTRAWRIRHIGDNNLAILAEYRPVGFRCYHDGGIAATASAEIVHSGQVSATADLGAKLPVRESRPRCRKPVVRGELRGPFDASDAASAAEDSGHLKFQLLIGCFAKLARLSSAMFGGRLRMKRESKSSSGKQRRSHLSSADLEALRAALEAKRAEVQRVVEKNISEGTHSEESSPDARDSGDVAERTEEEEELLGVAGQEGTLLSEIDRALAKMDKGTYGVSELSGRPIPVERLRALPSARFTAEEEAEIEQRRREDRQRTRTRN